MFPFETFKVVSVNIAAAAAAKSLQLCPTLWDTIDHSPPGSAVPGILQASTLEWVAISFSNAWKWKVKVKSFSRFWLFMTPWTEAYQAPPSMGFARQEYWSGNAHQMMKLSRCSFLQLILEDHQNSFFSQNISCTVIHCSWNSTINNFSIWDLKCFNYKEFSDNFDSPQKNQEWGKCI